MLEKKSLSDQLIIKCLLSDYGIKVNSLTLLPWGADLYASLYKAEGDEKSYFIKVKQGSNQNIGVIIAELLCASGIQEIIPPLKTKRGDLTQGVDDFTLIAYPFINGVNGFTHNLSDRQWLKLGKSLRQIHEITLSPAIKNQIRYERYSPKWRDAVRALYPLLLADPAGDETRIKLFKFMKDNLTAIHQLVDRADLLAKKLQENSHEFVLCHSDIHGGNVLVDEGNNLYIVDWDDPIMAPKERDLMFMGGGVANVWNKSDEEKLFYKSYGKTEVDLCALAYYRHERIVEDIAVYGQEILLTDAGGSNRHVMYKDFIGMFHPQGVVDIAFKTYKDYISS